MTLAYFDAESEEGASQVGTYTEVEVTNADTAAGLVTPPPSAQSKLSPQGPTTRSKSARKVSDVQVLAAFSFFNEVAANTPMRFVRFALAAASAALGSAPRQRGITARQSFVRSTVPGAYAVARMPNALQHLQSLSVCSHFTIVVDDRDCLFLFQQAQDRGAGGQWTVQH